MQVELINDLLLILVFAWGLGFLFIKMGLPLMLGELVAGIILGPPLLGWVSATTQLELMSEFGIFFVMFYTGLEMDPRDLLKHIKPSLAVAVSGFILPFVLGFFTTRFFGGTTMQSLFVGMGISITAIAVGSVVLKSLRINNTEMGHIIIGAAIVDDILSLIGLSVLFGIARTGSIQIWPVMIILIKVCAFFGVSIIIGEFIVPRLTSRLTDEAGKGFTFALLIALFMAELAELAGLHSIIGAFVAGQFVRREIMNDEVYRVIADRFYGISYGFLVPIFFVSLSFHLHFDWTMHFIAFTVVLILAAVAGKLMGGMAVLFFGHNRKEGLVVGFGMNGRGAVELVVASVVLALSHELTQAGQLAEPLLTQEQFSALVLMAFATTLIAPISLKWSVVKSCRPDEGAAFCRIMEQEPRK